MQPDHGPRRTPPLPRPRRKVGRTPVLLAAIAIASCRGPDGKVGPQASPPTAVPMGSAGTPREPRPVRPNELCFTTGRAQVQATRQAGLLPAAFTFHVDAGEMRASVATTSGSGAALLFRYDGPSADTIPLSNGELRRQVGLKLRAQDACNVVYVMWHFEPEQDIVVSVKHNPGMHSYEACGPGGYVGIDAARAAAPPRVHAGDLHRLVASLEGRELYVHADGRPVWEGALPEIALSFGGPVGIRADNVMLSFDLLADGLPFDRCDARLEAPGAPPLHSP